MRYLNRHRQSDNLHQEAGGYFRRHVKVLNCSNLQAAHARELSAVVEAASAELSALETERDAAAAETAARERAAAQRLGEFLRMGEFAFHAINVAHVSFPPFFTFLVC